MRTVEYAGADPERHRLGVRPVDVLGSRLGNLRALGHNVAFALEQYRSKSDALLLGVAASEKRLLLTEDNDFGELIFRQAGRFRTIPMPRPIPRC